jgi:hypothetical protein
MKRWNVGFLLLLAWPLCGWSQQVVRTMPLVLQLDVNAQGQVSKATPMAPVQLRPSSQFRGRVVRTTPPPLPPALLRAARQGATHWRFKARTVNGKPVSGRTWAHTELQIVQETKSAYGVRLKYLSNGPYIYSSVVPRYPRKMRILHRYAGVVVEGVIQPDGSISDVRIVGMHGNATRSREFRLAALDTVRESKGYAEQINGHAVATRVRFPMLFFLSDMTAAEKHRVKAQVRKDMHPKGSPARVNPPLRSGQALAMDSPFVKQPSS